MNSWTLRYSALGKVCILLVATLFPFGGVAPLAAQELAVQDESQSAAEAEEDVLSNSKPTVLRRQRLDNNTVNTLISLPATQDAYVASNRPDSNFGGADSLLMGYNAQGNNEGALRILLHFDISGQLPSRAAINSAKVRLYLYSSTGDGSMNSVLRHLNSGWSEFEVTWNNHEPDWGGIDTSINVGTSPGWVEWDVTSLAKQWINGSQPNNGVIIQGDEIPSEHQRAFWSRSAGSGQHPQLVVDFSESSLDTTPPTSRLVHPTNPYQTSNTFRVQWEGTDNDSGIDYYDVQYRISGQEWQTWLWHTTDTQAEFTGQNGVTYDFRVRATDNAGNVEDFPDSPEAVTTVDTMPPVVEIVQLPQFTGVTTFAVNWSGVDPESGIRDYDVQFRYGVQPYQDWLVSTTQLGADAAGAPDQTITFRVRATDNAGNVTPWDSANSVTSTTVDITPPTARITPFDPSTTAGDSFVVRWSGDDGNGSGIQSYDVRYRKGLGEWQPWQSQTPTTNATFTQVTGDGVYSFQVRATDQVGNQGEYTAGTGMFVNSGSIVLDPIQYLPLGFSP